ncbi:MAG: hypothetical protein JST16_05250 [Bdellovibrionales bacterium]|nr:hypothetical protein [Bdellovibrionales bacterium]
MVLMTAEVSATLVSMEVLASMFFPFGISVRKPPLPARVHKPRKRYVKAPVRVVKKNPRWESSPYDGPDKELKAEHEKHRAPRIEDDPKHEHRKEGAKGIA